MTPNPRRGRIGKGKGSSRWESAVGPALAGLALAPLLLLVFFGAGCGRQPAAGPVPAAAAVGSSAPAPATPPAAAVPRVVFLGDSLTAGLGLSEAEAYPALVRERLAERGIQVRVVNAGISGDTSAGGLARVDWLLTQKPDLLVVALGANDGLRGQPVAAVEANLREIVRRAQAAGARVLLAGMKMPPNYGPDYTRDFEALYGRLARELDVAYLPFLLEGVAAVPDLNQPDGIHPTAEGQRRIARLVADALLPLLADSVGGKPGS
jgi:acyl-CoA thioesterase-1